MKLPKASKKIKDRVKWLLENSPLEPDISLAHNSLNLEFSKENYRLNLEISEFAIRLLYTLNSNIIEEGNITLEEALDLICELDGV